MAQELKARLAPVSSSPSVRVPASVGGSVNFARKRTMAVVSGLAGKPCFHANSFWMG